MNIAIIADDLTGANDSGVQLARCGLTASVLLRRDMAAARRQDAVVLDTDSRSLCRDEAYRRVTDAARFVQSLSPAIVFKKIDSTLRGRIGAELDAVYDVLRPDLVVIAPAFPSNGRTVVNGWHYVHDRLLHETEVADDPKTPVNESYVPRLLEAQTARKVGLLACAALREGPDEAAARLRAMREGDVPYVVCDAACNDDLRRIVEAVGRTEFRVVWAGSAGLAHYVSLPLARPTAEAQPLAALAGGPVVTVVGSVSARSRRQLEQLLAQPGTAGVEVQTSLLLASEEAREREIARACEAAAHIADHGQHPALYSSGGDAAIVTAMQAGRERGMTRTDIGDAIAAALADTAVLLFERCTPGGIVLTGGDTARHVCDRLDAERFELVDEIEAGVPVGRLIAGGRTFAAITKAGGFGSDRVLITAMERMKGESGG